MSFSNELNTQGLYVSTSTFLHSNVRTTFNNVKFLPKRILAASKNSLLDSSECDVK